MLVLVYVLISIFFFQAEDVIRVGHVTGVQTCALPISIFFGPFDHLTDWEGVVLTPLYLGHPAPQHRLTRQSEPESELSIPHEDRKSTRLNSSHVAISYAVFCLQKKNRPTDTRTYQRLTTLSPD